MAYVDEVGQFTFRREAKEGVLDPEYYTCICPQCVKAVSGRSNNRGGMFVVEQHSWVFLPTRNVFYCSIMCAKYHDAQGVTEYLASVAKQLGVLQTEMNRWL